MGASLPTGPTLDRARPTTPRATLLSEISDHLIGHFVGQGITPDAIREAAESYVLAAIGAARP